MAVGRANLTGAQAKERIIEEVYGFATNSGTKPTEIQLSLFMAYDFAKCDRNEIGELSDKLLHYGVDFLETVTLLGCKVRINRSHGAPDVDVT